MLEPTGPSASNESGKRVACSSLAQPQATLTRSHHQQVPGEQRDITVAAELVVLTTILEVSPT